MNNVLLNEAQLESLITRYESKIVEISGKLEEIKNKTKIVDGDTEIWRSKAQTEFKLKKGTFLSEDILNKEKSFVCFGVLFVVWVAGLLLKMFALEATW